MKKTKILSGIIGLAVVISLITSSCKKEENRPATEGKVKFAINLNTLKSEFQLKANSITDVKTAILTIQTSAGEATEYTSSELNVQNMNGVLYTQKIVLLTGDYQLTEFLLLDASGATIYAVPLEGSELAVHVEDPLPIDFTVIGNAVTPINVEVLSTENTTPDQFGMVSFTIVEVPTFEFKIGVIDNATNKVITATLRLTSGDYTFDEELDSTLTNNVLVKDGFASYTLSIIKAGYTTFTHLYSVDSLKMYGDSLSYPLIIELNQLPNETVTDIDGNIYNTVTIGAQVWMAENLKTSRLNDGTEILLKEEDAHWETPGPPWFAYCWYDNDSATYANPYGALYNWDAVETGDLCPDGWHVPSRDEFDTLITYLGGSVQAEIKLKEAGIEHWPSPNVATNESGFTAVPAGNRHDEEGFYSIGLYTAFWTSTPYFDDPYRAWILYLNGATIGSNQTGKGFSIRCLKD